MIAPWRTNELRFKSSGVTHDPYRDQHVTVTFANDSGDIIRRSAFWDGALDWAVRFAAPSAGRWRYSVQSSPADPGLDGVSGSIDVVEAKDEPLSIYRHGFIRPSVSRRHLEHADGTPFFWLGDTHWRFTSESWDQSNKSGWKSQFRGTVDLRAEQGFSVYQSNLLGFGDGGATSPIWGTGNPYQQLDIDYVKSELDPRFEYVAASGLVHALGLAWYPAVDKDVPGLARLARYVVARYGSYPMTWTLGGEVAGYDPQLREQRINGWRSVALAIRETNSYRHPLTAHLTNERPLASYYQGEDWLDLTLHQHGHGDLDMGRDHYLSHLETHPGTPLIEGEGMYEGITTVEPVGRRISTDTMVRQVAYRAIQSGCCGYTYGAQGCWDATWDRNHPVSNWGDLPWHDGVDLPGGAQMGHLRRFYESLPWTQLRPDDAVFDAGGMINAVFYPPAVTATPNRRVVVAYFGETYRNGEGAPRLVGLTDGAYRLRWFDPRTGAYLGQAHVLHTVDGQVDVPAKPDNASDWILVAEDVSAVS